MGVASDLYSAVCGDGGVLVGVAEGGEEEGVSAVWSRGVGGDQILGFAGGWKVGLELWRGLITCRW